MPLTTVEAVATALRWGDAEKAKHSAAVPAYIAAADQIIEAEAGPFELDTRTVTLDGGPSVVLPVRANAVTAVLVDGVAVTDYTADLGAGIIYGPFSRGIQNVTLEVEVGFDTIPPAVAWAATALVAHMWALVSQRGPGLPEDFTTVPTGFLVPNAVKQALAPFKTMPGFA